jgi:hypothetical protein
MQRPGRESSNQQTVRDIAVLKTIRRRPGERRRVSRPRAPEGRLHEAHPLEKKQQNARRTFQESPGLEGCATLRALGLRTVGSTAGSSQPTPEVCNQEPSGATPTPISSFEVILS